MYVLHAEERSAGMSAKQLKKSGLIPGNVYGGALDKSLLIQLQQHEIRQMLKSKTTGNRVTLRIGGGEHHVMIKEIGRNPMGDKIQHLSFQSLAGDTAVVSAARIVVMNREKVSNFIHQRLYEIPLKAFPPHLAEEAEIDLEGMPAGTYVRVKDLDIARNENVELLIDSEALVLSIEGGRRPHADY